ncbi:ABC transporter substrate-binding protein [Conexibacter sp. W3-3-2]|nr:ABC transporter substrate-binding protein [Conexibacter sp. W3-3-2]
MPSEASPRPGLPAGRERPSVLRRTLAVLAVGAGAVGLVACGGSDDEPNRGTSTGSDSLTVYSSLPLTGEAGERAASVSRGEKLALLEAGGRVGGFTVKYVGTDDGSTDGPGSDPEKVIANAQTAARDKTAIAFLGGLDGASSAVSIPVLNQATVPQVSPLASYTGLTQADGAAKGEPDKYYPSGRRTFARVVPDDAAHADAAAGLLAERECTSLFVLHDRSLDGRGIADAVTLAAPRQELKIAKTEDVDLDRDVADDEAERLLESGADCLFYGGEVDRRAVALLRVLGTRAPSVRLFATGAPQAEVVARLGAVAQRLVLTSPELDAENLPASGRAFLRTYRERYGREPDPAAIYGYEAMKLVLLGIEAAGERGNDRQAVIDAILDVRDRRSALGTYSITRTGDTTLDRFAVRRLDGERLVVDAVLPSGD